MTRWERIQRLFASARSQPPDNRGAFLLEACDDVELRRVVARMLDATETEGLRIESRLLVDDVAAGAPDKRDSEPGPGGGVAGDDSLIGACFGPYRIERRIGRGGSADVYRAADSEHPDTTVALKVLRDRQRGAHMAERFQIEHAILKRLAHPHIARILGGGLGPEQRPYLAIEYVDGLPLGRHLDAHPTSLADRLHLFAAVCRAVQFAHARGVLHRDLKLSNVMVNRSGQIVLLDFGIAKLLDPADADGLNMAVTPAGVRLLTPGNAAPERVLAQPATVQTDVYGLGLILYQLIADRPALDPGGKSWIEWETTVLEEKPLPLSEVLGTSGPGPDPDRRALSSALAHAMDGIVARALAKRPTERQASVEELIRDVEAAGRSLPGLAL